ncbi:MAG: IgGFc-binding protein [Deltaproteobacteria bacterium]|nr:IgGFc-binding protein [Deltaproteobacteria bacterium]
MISLSVYSVFSVARAAALLLLLSVAGLSAAGCGEGALGEADGSTQGTTCKTNGECPSGKVCDTAAGVCVSEGDGGTDPGTRKCTPGEKSCVGDDLSVCNAEGSAWVRQYCPEGMVCRGGECKTPSCTPGERKCTAEGLLQSCDPATSTWVQTECGERRICVNSKCMGVICNAGEKRCAGDGSVQTCNDMGTGFASEKCPGGQICEIDTCKDIICSPAETKCTDNGTILNTCNSVGTAWDQVQCGVGSYCDVMTVDGGSVYMCLSQTCAPGEKRCAPGDGAVQECNGGGTAWIDTPCVQGFICENAACVQQICTPGEVKCCTDADAPLCTAADTATTTVCNDKGTARDLKGCGAATICIADKCVPKVCSAGFTKCDGDKIVECNAQGTAFTEKETCSDPQNVGNHCVFGRCMDACTEAEMTKAYIGCEYWPTVTMNTQLADGFDYAVAVSNTHTATASVTVTRGASTVATETVAPGEVKTIVLPWVPELKGTFQSETSLKLADGAYVLKSSVPVTVYQFNPLQFQAGSVFSYSNDASLLLPTHVLSTSYYALAYQSLVVGQKIFLTVTFRGGSPSIFAVVGTQAGTTVTVKSSCNTLPGQGGVGTYTPGQTVQFSLGRGEVLQIGSAVPTTCSNWEKDPFQPIATDYYCNVGKNYDVTGSSISADKPVAVFSGHNCAFVPYNRWACDHMEEQMFPVETWGNHYILTHTVPKQSPAEPNLYRIISASAGNKVTFNPASVHADVILDKGGWIEFSTDKDFELTGTMGFAVGQLMVGENYNGTPTADVGDPSLSLGVPVEQYRTYYNFLTPATYTESFVNITAPAGAAVTLDGQPVSGFTPVGSGAYSVAKIQLQPGQHTINSPELVGIVVYGYASYTSYMYPGGLNLLPLNE